MNAQALNKSLGLRWCKVQEENHLQVPIMDNEHWVNEKSTIDNLITRLQSQTINFIIICHEHILPEEEDRIIQLSRQYPFEVIIDTQQSSGRFVMLPLQITMPAKSFQHWEDGEKLLAERLIIKRYGLSEGQVKVGNEFKMNTFLIKKQDKLIRIPVEEIILVQAWEKYSLIYTLNGSKHIYPKSLKYVRSQTDGLMFLQVHKSFLINKEQIREVTSKGKVVLVTGKEVPLSRRLKKGFMEALKKI